MFGVVLWSDSEERKAVIWCEDHGDLAFYRDEARGDAPLPLDTGDWVQFDLTTDRNMRFAHNPRLLAEGVYPGLADALGVPDEQAPQRTALTRKTARSADIIPFGPARTHAKAISPKAAPSLA